MLQGAFTLLTRALREDATQRRAHAFRLGGILLILAFLITAHISSGGVAAPGLKFFELISWLNLALIVLAGASYFATAITEEKEQGTLGLLQLAGVSSLGLLLGKSTSRLIAVLLVFLGQLPFAMLAITLGGVTARQIIAVDIALAALLVMVANVGLLSSVLSRRSGIASAWVLSALAILLLGAHYGEESLAVLVLHKQLPADSTLVNAAERMLATLNDLSIITRLDEVLETGFDGPVIGPQAWLHVAVGMTAFLLSWMAFSRFTRYADVSAPARGWLPNRKSRLQLLVSRPGKLAILWKDYHFLTGGHALAILKLIAYPLLLLLLWRYQDVAGIWNNYPTAARNLMLLIIAGEACFYASRMFHEETKWGTLSSLALLPKSTAAIAYQKTAGCLLALAPATVVYLGLITVMPTTTANPTPGDTMLWWGVLMHVIVLLHLTILCSLTVKWGALALAVATLLILDALLSIPFSILIAGLVASYDDERAAIGPIIYLGCGISAVLQVVIAHRIRNVAAR